MVVDAGLNDAGYESSTHKAAGQDNAGSGTGESHARPAPDLPDPHKLAQDWITLWQSELSAMAADPEMRASWQSMMALWAGTMSAMLRGMPRGPTAERYDRASEQAGTADAPRTAPADAAPDARDAEIKRLARHVAILERRLADLERGGHPPVDSERHPERKPRN